MKITLNRKLELCRLNWKQLSSQWEVDFIFNVSRFKREDLTAAQIAIIEKIYLKVKANEDQKKAS